MATDLNQLSERIEECYEFTLSFAARGVTGDEGSDLGRQLRERLAQAVEAMRGLSSCCAETLVREGLKPREKYAAFSSVLERDAEGAIAAMELVLEQPSINSQLIDNLNASIHLRALLADLFLLTEILEARHAKTLEVK